MATAHLNTDSITDWQSLHETCRKAFGFPGFYGMNLNTWIDCMSYLDEDTGMTRFILAEGEMLHIEVADTASFNRRLPEVLDELVECSAIMNQRCLQAGRAPVLSLIFL
jgi:hypothetical protein